LEFRHLRSFRRPQAFAVSFALAAMLVSPSTQAATTVTGTIANQPGAPVKLQACLARIDGTALTPDITFAPNAPSAVTSSVVRYAFFNAANTPLGKVDISPPYSAMSFPAGATSFTCSIVRENLADGTIYAPVTTPASNAVPYIGAGVGLAALIALLAGKGGGSSPGTPTPITLPTPTSVPTVMPTAIHTGSPSPVPTGTTSPAGQTPPPTASPIPTITPVGQTPAPRGTPSPVPTKTPVGQTPAPTASPITVPTISPPPTISPVPTVTPLPTTAPPGVLNIQPSELSFTAVPSPNPTQTAVVSEIGYSGTFTLSSSSCSEGSGNTSGNIATISPTTGSGPSLTVVVTAEGAGHCTFTYSDSNSQSKTLTVDVSTTTVVVNKRKKSTAPAPKPRPGSPPGPTPAALPLGPRAKGEAQN
jgi:hypothetical protein